MGALSDQAAAIAAVVDAITNSGVVYDYQPSPRGNDLSSFVSHFVVTISTKTQIRAWTVAYNGESGEERTVAIGAMKMYRRINWLVRFFQSWDDTSEVDFRNLTELAVLALNASQSLGGTVIRHTPCVVSMPNAGQGVVLGDYGCHLAEIRLTTTIEATLQGS